MTADKTILITGASRGMGLGIAREMKKYAKNLALVASQVESFESVRQEFSANTKFYGTNFCSMQNVKSLAEQLKKDFACFDVIINNCGGYLEKNLDEVTYEEIQELVDLNLTTPMALTQALLPMLRAGKNQQLINISSISAFNPEAKATIYSASKSGLAAFSRALRKELNPEGIRVTAIYPGAVNTWNDPEPEGLLTIDDVSATVGFIVNSSAVCQFDELTLTPV